MVHKTKIPEGMSKAFWLDYLATEIAERVLTSQQYEKKLNENAVVKEYELSPEDEHYVLTKSKELIQRHGVHKIKKMSTDERLKKGIPIEVWETSDGSWRWEVYRKYQKPEGEAKNPFARWFCKVKSPFTPQGDIGDVYIKDIKSNAKKVQG
jgi:hypothetical protein